MSAPRTSKNPLTAQQWLAVIPIPPVFMISPFLEDGVHSWMGWVEVVLVLLWIVLLGTYPRRWYHFLVLTALVAFYVMGILKAFGHFDNHYDMDKIDNYNYYTTNFYRTK